MQNLKIASYSFTQKNLQAPICFNESEKSLKNHLTKEYFNIP